jgi:hypothetical protein
MPFGLNDERRTEVADELHRAAAYFRRLANEIDEHAAPTNQNGLEARKARRIADDIELLSYWLTKHRP